MNNSNAAIRARWALRLKKALLAVEYAQRVIARHLKPDHPKPVVARGHGPRFGIDWAWGQETVRALKAAGATFACRYLSRDPSKNLSAQEARTLSQAGIDVVVVWEAAADRALQGFAAGKEDALQAMGQSKAVGQPKDRPIFFAVDFDEAPFQAARVAQYFRGVVSVLGVARTGVYGGYWVVKRLFDAGLVKYGWQTYAWSGGLWDQRAQLHQTKNGQRIGGVDCDFNEAVAQDFGQWRVS